MAMCQKHAASSVYQKPAPVPKKPLQEKHVQMLKEKPSFAAKFDQVYGEGMAESILYDGAGSKKLLTADTYRGGEAPQMFPDIKTSAIPKMISPLNFGKLGDSQSSVGVDEDEPEEYDEDDEEEDVDPNNPEASNSPRTVKWRKENEHRDMMGLKPKVHPSKKGEKKKKK